MGYVKHFFMNKGKSYHEVKQRGTYWYGVSQDLPTYSSEKRKHLADHPFEKISA